MEEHTHLTLRNIHPSADEQEANAHTYEHQRNGTQLDHASSVICIFGNRRIGFDHEIMRLLERWLQRFGEKTGSLRGQLILPNVAGMRTNECCQIKCRR
jgi:hypothetical protein